MFRLTGGHEGETRWNTQTSSSSSWQVLSVPACCVNYTLVQLNAGSVWTNNGGRELVNLRCGDNEATLWKGLMSNLWMCFVSLLIRTFRCTLTSIPQTQALLNKARLPLGLLLHPFRDLQVRFAAKNPTKISMHWNIQTQTHVGLISHECLCFSS